MRIVHICLAASYIEGFGYQENILPQFHAKEGNEVLILTSNFNFNNKYEKIEKKNKDYINNYGIHVKVLKEKRFYSKIHLKNFKLLYEELIAFSPDIIFVHGGQFISLKDVVKYCKNYPKVKLYIDQHADYYNTPVDTLKRKIAHKIIFGYWMRKAIKYCNKFWGVTPWRCQYLEEIYGIPKEKIELLVMGGDDRFIHFEKMPKLREEIRNSLKLKDDDFVIITGGKIDKAKNIHLLMQAVKELSEEKIKLVVFGQPNDEMELLIKKLSKDSHIRNIGWLDSTKVYDYFLSSDLICFPGTHSVLWEQACACGVPIIVKNWPGMHHVDIGGNCIFLNNDSVEEIKKVIVDLYSNKEKYQRMKKISIEKGISTFSYKKISMKAIGLDYEYSRK